MQTLKYIFVSSLMLGLAACNGGGGQYSDGDLAVEQMQSAPAPVASKSYAMREVSADSSSQPAPPPTNTAENPTNQSFLAYRYNYSFSLPVKSVESTMQSHMETCLQAGPDICQVLSSSSSANENSDYANAYLRIRAEPAWLTSYREDLESSVKNAKGLITNSGVTAEDLTRSILDTDARLKAQITLRTRLEGLLETRNAKLSDLLSLERELARVQGQIESATTTLNVLKKRVSMSVVDMNYQTKQVAVSTGAFSPIGKALKAFIGQFSHGLADVIRFLAGFLPWLIFVILPLIWLLRWFWLRMRRKKATTAKPSKS